MQGQVTRVKELIVIHISRIRQGEEDVARGLKIEVIKQGVGQSSFPNPTSKDTDNLPVLYSERQLSYNFPVSVLSDRLHSHGDIYIYFSFFTVAQIEAGHGLSGH